MGRKVCILTTVHPPFDTRIFHKQAKTLVRAGYDVTLIAQHDKDEIVDGVKIIGLPKPRNRLSRIFGLTWRAFRLALKQRADVYHFHDPELIPLMFILGLLWRRPIIYDVHEDYVTSILQKRYLPRISRPLLAKFIGVLEDIATSKFTIILAERYYAERFPSGVTILNYQILYQDDKVVDSSLPDCVDAPRLLYTGSVSEDRGALIHASIPRFVPDVHVYIVGRCSSDLAIRLRDAAFPEHSRLHLDIDAIHVPYTRIRAYYAVRGWLAGLALFPPTHHYMRKELTKFFEYMAAGLPVIASNFPLWREIVEGNRCGICVDPLNPKEIAGAIEYLITHPEEARQMGENGRRAVEEKYNWEKEAIKLLQLYKELLSR